MHRWFWSSSQFLCKQDLTSMEEDQLVDLDQAAGQGKQADETESESDDSNVGESSSSRQTLGNFNSTAGKDVAGAGDTGGEGFAVSPEGPVQVKKERKNRQKATEMIMSKTLELYCKGQLSVKEVAKDLLKKKAENFLGDLLQRPQVSGSLDKQKIIEAIDNWIPKEGNLGRDMRYYHCLDRP